MPEHSASRSGAEAAERAAAHWALRCADGLSPAEEFALAAWLATDPDHPRRLAEYRGAWARFEPMAAAGVGWMAAAATPGPRRRGRSSFRQFALPALAAAAAIAFGLWWQASTGLPVAPRLGQTAATLPLPAPCEQRTLADGTVVEVNRGAEVTVEFTSEVRRVRLLRGEASFAVTKDPRRPFVVVAGAVEARAVGTVFNVRRGTAHVEVLVTEGAVRVGSLAPAGAGSRDAVLITAGQQVAVALDSPVAVPAVNTLSVAEMERRLAWQPRLLEFDDVPLAEIVAAFNRRNPVELVLADPALAAERMTATFRSDNVEGFVRLLEANYGIRLAVRDGGAIQLRRP